MRRIPYLATTALSVGVLVLLGGCDVPCPSVNVVARAHFYPLGGQHPTPNEIAVDYPPFESDVTLVKKGFLRDFPRGAPVKALVSLFDEMGGHCTIGDDFADCRYSEIYIDCMQCAFRHSIMDKYDDTWLVHAKSLEGFIESIDVSVKSIEMLPDARPLCL